MITIRRKIISRLGDSIAVILSKNLFEDGVEGHFIKVELDKKVADTAFISVLRNFDKSAYFFTIPSVFAQYYNIFRGDYLIFNIQVSIRSVRG